MVLNDDTVISGSFLSTPAISLSSEMGGYLHAVIVIAQILD